MVTGGLLVLFLFSSLVNAIISSKVQLVPGSEVAEAFLNPPVKPLLKVYYFNVTNPEEYLAGGKIKLDEIGPFVYQEAWSRRGVEWSEDDTEVKFRMKRSYQYRADLSSGSLSDPVTLPNVPMFVGFLLTPTSIPLSLAGDVQPAEEHWTGCFEKWQLISKNLSARPESL